MRLVSTTTCPRLSVTGGDSIFGDSSFEYCSYWLAAFSMHAFGTSIQRPSASHSHVSGVAISHASTHLSGWTSPFTTGHFITFMLPLSFERSIRGGAVTAKERPSYTLADPILPQHMLDEPHAVHCT